MLTGSRTNASLLGLTMKRMISSNVNQPLQTHSMKKNASCGSVLRLSSIHMCLESGDDEERWSVIAAVVDRGPTLKLAGNCASVRLLMTGSRRFGWVLRQKISIETSMKNTDTIATTCEHGNETSLLVNCAHLKMCVFFRIRVVYSKLSSYGLNIIFSIRKKCHSPGGFGSPADLLAPRMEGGTEDKKWRESGDWTWIDLYPLELGSTAFAPSKNEMLF